MTIKFTIEYQYPNGDMQQRTSVEIPQDSSLMTVVEAFEQFLKGAGYVFDGYVDIVDSTESNDDQTEKHFTTSMDNSIPQTMPMPGTMGSPKIIFPQENKTCSVCGLTREQLGIYNCYDPRCGLK